MSVPKDANADVRIVASVKETFHNRLDSSMSEEQIMGLLKDFAQHIESRAVLEGRHLESIQIGNTVFAPRADTLGKELTLSPEEVLEYEHRLKAGGGGGGGGFEKNPALLQTGGALDISIVSPSEDPKASQSAKQANKNQLKVKMGFTPGLDLKKNLEVEFKFRPAPKGPAPTPQLDWTPKLKPGGM